MVERSRLRIDLNDKVLEIGLEGNLVSFNIIGERAFIEMASDSMISIFFGRLIGDIIAGKIFDIEDDDFFTYSDGKLKVIYEETKRMNQYFKERNFGSYITVNNNMVEVKNKEGNVLRLSRYVDKICIEIEHENFFVVPGTSRIFHVYNKHFVQLFKDLQKYKDLVGLEEISNSYYDKSKKEFKKV